MKAVYSNIQRLRERAGISKKQMGVILNMDHTGYGRLENGETRLTIERLDEIAKFFNVRPEFILNYHKKEDSGNLQIITEDKLLELREKVEYKIEQLNAKERELKKYKFELEILIHTEYNKYIDKYHWSASFDELSDFDKEDLEVYSEEEFNNFGVTVAKCNPGDEQKAFEEMMEDISVFRLFNEGFIKDKSFLRMWRKFKKRGNTNIIVSKDGEYRCYSKIDHLFTDLE